MAVRAGIVDVAADGEEPIGVLASAARIASSPVLIISCASRIHSSPFFARGTIISRLPDSATVIAALRTAVHSSSVFGRISCEPSFVSIDLTASQIDVGVGIDDRLHQQLRVDHRLERRRRRSAAADEQQHETAISRDRFFA